MWRAFLLIVALKLPMNPSTLTTSEYVSSFILGCWSTSTIRGVSIHWEQSSVGNVLKAGLMWPPIDGSFSTRTTCISRICNIKRSLNTCNSPPITRVLFCNRNINFVNGLSRLTFFYRHADKLDRFICCSFISSMNPMNNAPVNLWFQQKIYSCGYSCIAESSFVHMGSMNLLLLHQASFHGLHLLSCSVRDPNTCICNLQKTQLRKTFTYFGNMRTINSSAYVLTAMTYKYSDFHFSFSSFCKYNSSWWYFIRTFKVNIMKIYAQLMFCSFERKSDWFCQI